mgnify:CR=1 FL=1
MKEKTYSDRINEYKKDRKSLEEYKYECVRWGKRLIELQEAPSDDEDYAIDIASVTKLKSMADRLVVIYERKVQLHKEILGLAAEKINIERKLEDILDEE